MNVDSPPHHPALQDPIHTGAVFVAPSPVHGRGVFAARAFAADEEIECCPVLIVSDEDRPHLDATALWGYYFEWTGGGGAVALGCGSLYNHSWTPNAYYQQDFDADVIRIHAVRPIAAGEEVTVNYTGEPEGRGELWFDAGPPPARL